MPGQTDARRFDSVTQLVRDDGVIDREGHFGTGHWDAMPLLRREGL